MGIRTKQKTAKKTHLVVKALAGTGKTTTMIDYLNHMRFPGYQTEHVPTEEQQAIFDCTVPARKVCFCAFNKAIAEELKTKVPPGIETSTIHSLGYKLLKTAFKSIKVNNDQALFLMKRELGYKPEDRLSKVHFNLVHKANKVVGLVKNFMLDPTEDNIVQLTLQYGIEVNGDLGQVCKLVQAVIKDALDDSNGGFKFISFDDMIYLPAKMGLAKKIYDLLIVDEAQDLNPAQHAIISNVADQVVLVGDDRQAIYHFRGSDSDSINNCKKMLDGEIKELTLTTTWRCPTSHVEAVNHIVPDLKAAPNAIEGEIHNIKRSEMYDHLKGGALVMCRTNGPLCSLAFNLLSREIPVRIQGREFSRQIISLINKLRTDDDSIPSLMAHLENYEESETSRIQQTKQFNTNMAVQNLLDKCTSIRSLSEGLSYVPELLERIEILFSEQRKEDQILLSTVHRAKGLEADDIFIIYPELMPFPAAKMPEEIEQETNLIYVAHTRGKKRKFIVESE